MSVYGAMLTKIVQKICFNVKKNRREHVFHRNLYLHSFGASLKWEREGLIGYRYNKKKNRTVVKRCGL